MRATNRLVAKGLTSLPHGKHADGGNLWFVKRPDGGAQWVLRIDVLGRRREMGLGPYPEVSLRAAREEAARWRAVVRGGADPVSERKRLREDAAAALARTDPTLEEYTKRVFDGLKAGLRGDGERGRWLSPLEQHVFPKLGKRRLSSIHQTDVVDALRPIWQSKHPTAIKVVQRLGVVFKEAKAVARLDVDPFIVEAARRELGKVRHTPTHIEATPWREVPALYRKLNADLFSHHALRWVILTAVRSESARGARFDEIDGDVWTVPAERMKAREGKAEAFRVPLSGPALELLDKLKAGASSPYLFPSTRKGQHLTDVALSKILNGLGEAGRIHGFRTSFRTWVQDTDAASFDVAETALAHTVGGKVERSYARSDLLGQRRLLMTAWANHIVAPIKAGAQ